MLGRGGARRRVRSWVDDRILLGCTQVVQAIRRKDRLICLYRGQVLLFCPQLLGHRPGGPVVLAFVLAGDPALRDAGRQSPARWRWLSVADMWGLVPMSGPWVAAPASTRPSLEHVIVELEATNAGEAEKRRLKID